MDHENRSFIDMMIVVGICRRIQAAMRKMEDREIDAACNIQEELTGKETWGFVYKGKIFLRSACSRQITQAIKGRWPSLHKDLWPKINVLDRERVNSNITLASIRQWMTLVTNKAECDQDKRDSIPDALAAMGEDWAKLPRVRPLREALHPSLRETYAKLEEDIDYFSALPLMVD